MSKTSSSPIECNICGHSHWKHQPHVWGAGKCASATTVKERKSSPPESVPKLPEATEPADTPLGMPATPTNVESAKTGISDAFTKAEKRKQYLMLKARERRARQKAAKAQA